MKSSITKIAKKAVLLSLKNSEVDPGRVKQVLDALVKTKFSERLSLLRQYRRLLAKKINENTLFVKTSFNLDQVTKQALETSLLKKFGSKKFVFEVEPALLGGIKIEANDNVFDYSISARLAQIKETFI